MKPLEKLFWEELAEMLHVERMLLKSLLKMHSSADGESLKKELEISRKEIQTQADRVAEIFELFEVPAREKKCDVMMSLLVKAQQMIQRSGAGPTLDAALVSLCRRINVYKLASYSSLISWARLLIKDEQKALKTLRDILDTETRAGARFERLAPEFDAHAAQQIADSIRRRVTPVAKKTNPEFADERWG